MRFDDSESMQDVAQHALEDCNAKGWGCNVYAESQHVAEQCSHVRAGAATQRSPILLAQPQGKSGRAGNWRSLSHSPLN